MKRILLLIAAALLLLLARPFKPVQLHINIHLPAGVEAYSDRIAGLAQSLRSASLDPSTVYRLLPAQLN